MSDRTIVVAGSTLNADAPLAPVTIRLHDDGTFAPGSKLEANYPTTIAISVHQADSQSWTPANLTLHPDGTYLLQLIDRSEMKDEHHVNELVARYARFEGSGWRLQPSSYQLRNADGSPGGWIAQVHVWHDTRESSTVQPLQEVDPRVYPTQGQANFMALRMGVKWLEQKVGSG